MKLKHRFLILITVVIFIYVSGFISGRLIKPFRYKDVTNIEQIMSKIDLQNQYKIQSQSYIDSANSEMFNYSIKYYNIRQELLPNTYQSYDGKKVIFNKKNFFYYYSLYKITDYLSKSKTIIIKDLLESKKDTI